MPVEPMPTTVEACHARIRELELDNAVLKTRAEQTVGGFLERNGKSIIAILLGVLTVVGGGNLFFSGANHEKLNDGLKNQQQIAEKLDPEKEGSIAKRVEEVGSGIDDVKREVKKKKGPFGE